MPYFVALGIIITLITRRHLFSLFRLRFKFAWLIIISLIAQILLNVLPTKQHPSSAWMIELFFLLFIIALLFNWHIRGITLIVIGASLNLAALLLHHGAMPISLTGYHLIHPHAGVPNVGSRHVITSATKAWWLVDWIPVAPYLMSPGDILVGLGIMSLIYLNSSKRGEKVIAQNQ